MEKKPISELSLLPQTEKCFRINERLEEFHAENYDWANVLRDKWYLAKWAQEGGN
jgi:hypothetical protein